MSSFFKFNRGEQAAVFIITIFFLGNILFSLFYRPKSGLSPATNKYAEAFDLFQQEQKNIADSIERIRQKKDRNSNKREYFHSYSDVRNSSDTGKKSYASKKELYSIIKLNINQCDSSEIIRIPLFGPKRASKLIEYRKKLGGYHSFDQITEIYILQAVSKEHYNKYFYIDLHDIIKIAINRASYAEMVRHPYFDSYLAKSIIHYREKNGGIYSWDEFQKATNAYPELIKRLEHYLTFE